MKKIILSIYLIGSLSVSQLSAGEAIIPFWSNGGVWSSCYSISNITATNVMLKVELYDTNGELFTNNLKWNTNITALNTNTILEANKTAFFCLDKYSNSANGYGRILTTDIEGNNAKGLVMAYGFGYRFRSDERGVQIPINNNLPF